MTLIRGLHNVRDIHHKAVVTIGNFDGMHRGHQVILQRVVESAKQRGVPSMLISFEPQPLEFFARHALMNRAAVIPGVPQVVSSRTAPEGCVIPSSRTVPEGYVIRDPDFKDMDCHGLRPRNDGKIPARLTRLREKCFFLEKFGIDYFLCLPFNKKLADMSAQDFVQKVLLDLNISEIIVGDDFKFGKGRQGDVALLKSMGVNVQQFESQLIHSERVSSTLVREALQSGELKRAEQFLGRPYSMIGRVVHGAKLGRQWGIPTANIFLHRHVSPVRGIFAVRVHGLHDKVYHGVANIGNRPTVDGSGRTLLEVHLFDFDADIYGHMVEVEFCAKRRDEERYETVDLLIAEIKDDILWAREWFRAVSP